MPTSHPASPRPTAPPAAASLWAACEHAVRSTGLEGAAITAALACLSRGEVISEEQRDSVDRLMTEALSISERALDDDLQDRWQDRYSAACAVWFAAAEAGRPAQSEM